MSLFLNFFQINTWWIRIYTFSNHLFGYFFEEKFPYRSICFSKLKGSLNLGSQKL